MKILYAHLGLYTKTLAILPSPKRHTSSSPEDNLFSLPPAISLTLTCTFQKCSQMSPFPGKCMDTLILMPSSIPSEHSKLYPRPYHPDCKCQFWNSYFLKELESKLLEPSSVPGMQGSLSEFVELTTERESNLPGINL